MSKISLSDRQKGMISIILSAFCFAWMNAFVRLSGDLPFIEKSFFRNFVALLLALVMLLREHGSFRPKKGAVPYLLIRASAGTLGILCNFYAIDHLALSDASILNKMSPFFAILCSWLFLREKLNWKQGLIVGAHCRGALHHQAQLCQCASVPVSDRAAGRIRCRIGIHHGAPSGTDRGE